MLTYNLIQHQLPVPPPHAKFTPIRTVRDQVICAHPIDSVLLDHQTNDTVRSSFAEYLASLDPRLKHILGNLPQQEIDTEFWISALQYGIVTVASDGSVKNGCGSYAVVFQAGEKTIWFQGPVYGHPSLSPVLLHRADRHFGNLPPA
eukprot:15195748-Ditylum_brightwellii.AAC.1